MGNADARTRHQLTDAGRALVDGIHTVVQVVDLPAAGQLLANGLRDDALIVFQHISLDGLTLERRLFNRGHIADAGQRHVQRAGDRRGRQGQHIDTDEVFFELLFMLDAEALLLVDDDKAQIVELHIVGQQPVRAHNDIHRAVF